MFSNDQPAGVIELCKTPASWFEAQVDISSDKGVACIILRDGKATVDDDPALVSGGIAISLEEDVEGQIRSVPHPMRAYEGGTQFIETPSVPPVSPLVNGDNFLTSLADCDARDIRVVGHSPRGDLLKAGPRRRWVTRRRSLPGVPDQARKCFLSRSSTAPRGEPRPSGRRSYPGGW